MFDCVYPTRNARHGSLIFKLDQNTYTCAQIGSVKFQLDFSPINSNSIFEELRIYSKAYLCHLFRANEMLALRLATLNNLEFYFNLMAEIRERIDNNTFEGWWQNYGPVKTQPY